MLTTSGGSTPPAAHGRERSDARARWPCEKILYVPFTRKVSPVDRTNCLPSSHVYSMCCTVLIGFKTVPHQLNAFAGFLVRELMFTDVADLNVQQLILQGSLPDALQHGLFHAARW
ncbi:MAG: hypothetical protein KF908_15190 [Nitrosomonas sp.]|nr:hypothetical protein [Nitrosomonas sp.]